MLWSLHQLEQMVQIVAKHRSNLKQTMDGGIFIAARTRAHSTHSLSLQTSRLRDHLEEGYVMGEREAEK